MVASSNRERLKFLLGLWDKMHEDVHKPRSLMETRDLCDAEQVLLTSILVHLRKELENDDMPLAS